MIEEKVTALALRRINPAEAVRLFSSDELKEQFRLNYQLAVEARFIQAIALLAQIKGKTADGTTTYRDGDCCGKGLGITVRGASVTVTLGDRIVCANDVAGQEVFIVGGWIDCVTSALKQIEIEQNAAAQRDEFTEKQQILSILSDV